MPDGLKIVLEDVKEKFDTVMEGINLINEKLDRHVEENKKEHEEIKGELLHLRRDLNEHRNNTELHARKKKKPPDFLKPTYLLPTAKQIPKLCNHDF